MQQKLNKGFNEDFRIGKGKIRGRRRIRRANKVAVKND